MPTAARSAIHAIKSDWNQSSDCPLSSMTWKHPRPAMRHIIPTTSTLRVVASPTRCLCMKVNTSEVAKMPTGTLMKNTQDHE